MTMTPELQNWDQFVSCLKSIDLEEIKKQQIKEDPRLSREFQTTVKCCSCISRSQNVSESTHEKWRQELQMMMARQKTTLYKETDKHQMFVAYLMDRQKELDQYYRQENDLSLEESSYSWKELGFLSEDGPFDDLRGMGLLGLYLLCYFEVHFFSLAKRLYSLSFDDSMKFPYCICLLHLGMSVSQMILNGTFDHLILKNDSVHQTLIDLFVAMCFELYCCWPSQHGRGFHVLLEHKIEPSLKRKSAKMIKKSNKMCQAWTQEDKKEEAQTENLDHENKNNDNTNENGNKESDDNNKKSEPKEDNTV
eukprot:gb/GECH01013409.1/.p1 GENE.gb/GECH01013409.1/~~gb/GECH01013409.1/.p1  ORF type:complete len:307 (+),score=107.05 gb/GECH01013409.1/:1-921(+)